MAANSNSGRFTSETAPRVGRRHGAKGKYIVLRKNADLIAAAKEITPLEVLQGFAGDATLDADMRLRAADCAAPYVHPKKPQSLELSGSLKLTSTFADAVKAGGS
mgnify:FL=1